MSVPYIVNFEIRCTDCGTNTGVLNVTFDFNEIDLCEVCLSERNKIYDHAISFNFSIETSNKVPTVEEMKEAVLRYFNILSNDEIKSSFEVFSSELVESE